MIADSQLVSYVWESPNYTAMSNKKIDTIVIHHAAGMLTLDQFAYCFRERNPKSSGGSSTYAIDNNGRVGQFVPESQRQWCTGSYTIDSHAVTIELANDSLNPNWHVSDIVINKCIQLCIDICVRNKIKRINFTGDKTGNLQMHRWWANTLCPGNYLASMFPYIAEQINKGLKGVDQAEYIYCVQIGAFRVYSNALALKNKLTALGYTCYLPRSEDDLYRVQVGAFAIPSNATKLKNELRKCGYSDAYIVKRKVE